VLKTVDEGFPLIAGIINEAPEFVTSPNINPEKSDKFLLIVIATNLQLIPEYFNNYQDNRLIDLIIEKFSKVFEVEIPELKKVIKEYQGYLSRVNLPSKNPKYAMSKGIFYKYELNEFQEEYFKNMKSPNPMFLKRLDEAMDIFIWDWESFKDKYQVVN
jgi:hypothetical protein